MINYALTETGNEDTIPTPNEALIFALGFGTGLAIVAIGTRQLYKRYVRKVPPLETGE